MLQELYRYALDNGLSAEPGFMEKNVRWYITFGADGSFLGIEPSLGKSRCPDIGSLARGATKSNIIAEKAEIIFNLPDKKGKFNRKPKQEFYMNSLKEIAEFDELFRTAVKGLSEQQLELIKETYLADKKHKPSDIISLKVDGRALESSKDYLEWWERFRRSLSDRKASAKAGNVRCFITGEMTQPVATVPVFQGLANVNGHRKGDSLICFDKDEYCSYGLKQAANASVSEEAITAVNSSLNYLLKKENCSTLAGAKNIHWFKEAPAIDILSALDFDLDISVETDTDDDKEESNTSVETDNLRIKQLYKYVFDGKSLAKPDNRYYMMSLSGVNGRVMIRSFDEGSYDDLYNNITHWYNDLALITSDGKRIGKYPRLFLIETRLINYTTEKKVMERINKELSGLSPQLIYAITHDTQIPDRAAAKALAYIRSDLYASPQEDRGKRGKDIDRISCQILKAWLNRKYKAQNKEEYMIMAEINKDSPSRAYQIGRLMAVYARIQNKALGDVNAGVVEKYYTSACTAPSLVIGKLATMSQYHLSKLDRGWALYFSRMLEEIAGKIGCSIPSVFSMTEQAEFALGYYHQNAEMSRKKNNDTTDDDKED